MELVSWYLVEFVDVDLTLLVSLCAHEHRSADQQDVGVRVPVHVNGLQDAAEVGTDLHTQIRIISDFFEILKEQI